MTAILKFITGLAWWVMPSIIAALLAAVLGQQVRVSNARADAIEQRALSRELSAKVTRQNDAATAKFEELTARTKALQTTIDKDARTRAEQDEANTKTIDGLQGSLRNALRTSSRLCRTQSAASGGSSGSASGAVAANPKSRSTDPTETPGLLSELAATTLERLALEADQINNAYASCRGRAEADRATH